MWIVEHVWREQADCEHVWCEHVCCEHVCFEHVCCEHGMVFFAFFGKTGIFPHTRLLGTYTISYIHRFSLIHV